MKRTLRLLMVPSLIALIAVAILAVPLQAQAMLLCRSDPVVILSNGMVLDIGASISTLPMQVQEVHYELHVPAGVAVLAEIHTPAWLTSQETFTFSADQAAGTYQVATTVHTSVGNASVVADTLLLSPLGLHLGNYSVSGLEGQILQLLLHSS